MTVGTECDNRYRRRFLKTNQFVVRWYFLFQKERFFFFFKVSGFFNGSGFFIGSGFFNGSGFFKFVSFVHFKYFRNENAVMIAVNKVENNRVETGRG